jgi:hypothetical protein
VNRIPRSALLAPDIVEAPLDGRADHALMLGDLERPLPVCLKERQQERIGKGLRLAADAVQSLCYGEACVRATVGTRVVLAAGDQKNQSLDSYRPCDVLTHLGCEICGCVIHRAAW